MARSNFHQLWDAVQLKLNENELKQVIGCQISRNEYVSILKSKGLI